MDDVLSRGSLALVMLLALAAPAVAAERSTTSGGRTLTVSKATDVRVEGEKVRVRGSGYDRSKGIYVAFCVDNGPGKVPTPCGGGADTEGTSGNSVWISDLPPAYGTGLAQPYGEGGSFDVEIHVQARLRADDPETAENEAVDCRTVQCAVVTRNDHTRSEDRSQDVRVPIEFAAAAAPAAPAARPAAPAGRVAAAPPPPPASTTSTPTTSPTATTTPATGLTPPPAAPPSAAGEEAAVVPPDEPVTLDAEGTSSSSQLGLLAAVAGVVLVGAALGIRRWLLRPHRG